MYPTMYFMIKCLYLFLFVSEILGICSGEAQEMLRICSEDAQEVLRRCSEDAQDMLRRCSRDAKEMFTRCFGHICAMLKLEHIRSYTNDAFSAVFLIRTLNHLD